MQHRTVFGDVDDVAGEHLRAALDQCGVVGQFEQLVEHRIGDVMLGVVEEEASDPQAHALEALRVGSEVIADAVAGGLGLELFQACQVTLRVS